MPPKTLKRQHLVERMVDHVLAHGLAHASLRPLAQAAGTSDRMLLYYFADKDALLAAVLGRLAERMAAVLERAGPIAPLPPDQLLEALWARSRSPELAPYTTVMIELAAASMRQGGPYAVAVEQITRHFLAWLTARLDIAEDGAGGDSEAEAAAYDLLAHLDGRLLLDAIGVRAPG